MLIKEIVARFTFARYRSSNYFILKRLLSDANINSRKHYRAMRGTICVTWKIKSNFPLTREEFPLV